MIIEKDDAFEIDTGNLVVRSYRPDSFSFQLELQSPDKTWTLTIAGSCSLKDERGKEHGVEAAQLAGLVGKHVLSVRAGKLDGRKCPAAFAIEESDCSRESLGGGTPPGQPAGTPAFHGWPHVW